MLQQLERGLSSCAMQALGHGLSSCGARTWLLRSMWGSSQTRDRTHVPLHWQVDSYPLCLQGSLGFCFC